MFENVAIWMVLFAFYCFEHLKNPGERGAVLRIGVNDRVGVYIPYSPLEVMGRTFLVLPPLSFMEAQYLGTFCAPNNAHNASKGRELRRLILVRRALIPILILEPALAAFYFVVCPVLSLKLGFGYSLRYILPVHAAVIVTCSILVFHQPGRPLKTLKAKIGLIAEMLVSPGIIPALSKRIAGKLKIACDVPGCAGPFLNASDAARMGDALRYRLEELVNFGEVSEDLVKSYLTSVGSAR
jgi:hypothetical protein